MVHKLDNLKVTTNADLQAVPKHVLQRELGDKTGDMVYNFSRGIDNRKWVGGAPGDSLCMLYCIVILFIQ